MEYCSRPLADQPGKTCRDIGAMVRMQNELHNDPIFREYNKAYKRNNSRVRMGKISQPEFLQWSDEASALRDQCVTGALEEAAFFEWLNKDKNTKSRISLKREISCFATNSRVNA